jgi:uncharacterized protein YecT (DUF1311 family)
VTASRQIGALRLAWLDQPLTKGEGAVKLTVLLTAPVFVLLAALPAAAEMFGADYKPCGDQSNTLATVDCVAAKTKVWDQRLNTAYKNLTQRIDAGQRDPLKAAQRLWVQYRDANCRFYGSQDGSIREIQAAECLRAMTQDRALELEKAMKFD